MPSDGHSPYVGENGNWWQWNDKLQRYVDTGVSAKGVQGMPGQIPFQKEWKAGDTHRNDTNIVDYIYVRAPIPDNRKWYKLKNDYVVREVPGDEAYPTESTLSTYYDEIPWLKELAAKVLIGEEANLANLIFKDDKLISLRGTVNGVAADYSGQSNFVPNVVIDGKTGEIKAVNGEFGGTLKSVSGTFKRLSCIDNNGNTLGNITFGSDGNIWFESCGIYHQAPTAPFYLADAWVRGVLGSRERTVIRITASGAYVYRNGLSGASEFITLQSYTDSGGNTYYKIPLYSPTSASSGCPIDLVIINHNSARNYELENIPGKTVTVINSNDENSDVWIYSNGIRRNMPGGQAATFVCVGPFQAPDNSSAVGRGWLVSGYFDNTW